LAEELNVKPAQRTLALREQIRADQLTDTAVSATLPPPTAASDAQIITELKALQSHLAALQQEVKTIIQRLTVSP
jgi:hypothetical protein